MWIFAIAFFVKSIAEASSPISCRPVKKSEPSTPEIIGLTFFKKHYGEVKICLTYGLSASEYLPKWVFSLFLSFYVLGSLTLFVTEDHYHKIFVEVSKVDEYKEGSWLYIARNVHRHKKHSKENVLFSKPLSPGEREKFWRKN